ncbi:hypothetical protein FOL47_005028 [Perkinsus chesapeaki]|uniref:Uncharacterized protein n=1 Tax=Perkinsus chesapeaki TaxID=330153 RepID=A0A7J6LZI6_PERCH|nr:hypothetical protein FOL47_005028 [Perkinsus chesapeaki]
MIPYTPSLEHPLLKGRYGKRWIPTYGQNHPNQMGAIISETLRFKTNRNDIWGKEAHHQIGVLTELVPTGMDHSGAYWPCETRRLIPASKGYAKPADTRDWPNEENSAQKPVSNFGAAMNKEARFKDINPVLDLGCRSPPLGA